MLSYTRDEDIELTAYGAIDRCIKLTIIGESEKNMLDIESDSEEGIHCLLLVWLVLVFLSRIVPVLNPPKAGMYYLVSVCI